MRVSLLLGFLLLLAGVVQAQVSANHGGVNGGSVVFGNDSGGCAAANAGAVRYTGSLFQVCYGAGGWSNLVDTSGTAVLGLDRITSGTAGVYVSNSGVINLRTGGMTTGYFDTAGVLVGPGISVTTGNGISGTNGYFSGLVGVGIAAPSSSLHVSGSILTAPRDNPSTSIDWSRGNVQRTSAGCGAFTFTNMQDGGVYSLTVEGAAAGTCTFSQSGLNFRMPANHGSTTAGTMTYYGFLRSGANVFVSWIPEY